jgi:predicted acylesterase/phospholipase RssA
VGGAKGVAHLGAIEAVKQSGMKVDCVVGTSFGALAGSVYSTAPQENAPERYSRFMDAYVEQTRADKEDGALFGMLLFGALGGAGSAVLAGGFLGEESVNERDRTRFVNVLDRFYGAETIERLPIQFATLYQQRTPASFRNGLGKIGQLGARCGK